MDEVEAFVAVDASNFHYALISRKWRVDWEKFQDFCAGRFGKCAFFYYEGMPTKSQFFHNNPSAKFQEFLDLKNKKKKYFKFLKAVGYRVRRKPVHSVYDATEGRHRHKCNFDVEITVDALDHLPNIRRLVLCSGDGDFVRLVKYYKSKYKKVTVIADGDRLHWELGDIANQVLYLEDFREELMRK